VFNEIGLDLAKLSIKNVHVDTTDSVAGRIPPVVIVQVFKRKSKAEDQVS